MAENKNVKENESGAYENIKNMLELRDDNSLNALLKKYHDARRKLEHLLKIARNIEEEMYREPDEITDEEQPAAENEQAAVIAPENTVEQVTAPADDEAAVINNKTSAPEKKEQPPVKQEKTDVVVKPEKKEPQIRRINLEEIERKYGNNNRPAPRGDRPPYVRPEGTDSRPPRTFVPRQNNNAPYQPRPLNTPKPIALDTVVPKTEFRKVDNKKKEAGKNTGDGKKTMNKRTLIRKGFIAENFDEDRMGSRKLKKGKDAFVPHIAQKVEKAQITTENLTVKILSEKIGKPATQIIKQLMILGIMTTINSVVDFPTMELVANELGVEIELKLDKTKEEVLAGIHLDNEDSAENNVKRPPIVTVMGHVDHGKTSLLDALKKTNVAEGEAGGITQHIGAYTISINNEKITFIDTPGHEAFTSMRARGAKVTDIAILVVAADDGVMPQTIEAISHAKAANLPIIVAINKIDRPNANPDKIKQQLTEHNILPEEWGGDAIMVPVSAKTGEGLDKLLESILLVAEVNDFKANAGKKAKGTVIEAKLDKGKGPVATIIINNGTLKVGDNVVSGVAYGKIRAMQDDKGRSVKEALPSYAVAILGLNEVPNAGDIIYVVDDEKLAKQVADERAAKMKSEQLETSQIISLDDVFSKINEGQLKNINIIVKADVQGSVEAMKASLNKLSTDEVKIRTIHGGVGAINKSDIMLAGASNTIVIGFNVRTDSNETKALAEESGIDVRLYKIIYEAIEDIEAAIKGMETPTYHENQIAEVEVRNIFRISNIGVIAGSYVLNGKVTRNAKVRVVRNGDIIFDGEIESLKRFKDDVKEVAAGYECGISVKNFNDFKELDILKIYIMEKDVK